MVDTLSMYLKLLCNELFGYCGEILTMDKINKVVGFDARLCKFIFKNESEPLFGHTKRWRKELKPEFYSYQLFNLECFIEELLLSNEMPFIPVPGKLGKLAFNRPTWCMRYFRFMPSFIAATSMLPTCYEYDEHINVFVDCCRKLDLSEDQFKLRDFRESSVETNLSHDEVIARKLFNTLITMLRDRCRSKEIRVAIYSRRSEAKERFNEYCKYVNALFDANDRLVVLRIDLSYRKGFSNQVTINDAIADWEHLYANKRTNSIFDHLKGYIAKIEFGADKGIHFHVIFFFNGSDRNGDSHIHHAEQIGEYWKKTITKGRGDYWNCNDNIQDFYGLGRCGIGLIHWSDAQLRNNLLNIVVAYLCKLDQFIKPKLGGGVKLIRRGSFPKVPKNKLGRPRMVRSDT
jgi:Inovirus Gp2